MCGASEGGVGLVDVMANGLMHTGREGDREEEEGRTP